MSIFDLLQSVASELPGCLSTSIVAADSGLPLASIARGMDDDSAAASDAFHSNVYRNATTAIGELGAQQEIEGIVIEGVKATYLSIPLGDTGFFWHVATESGTTLGFTQAVMRKRRDEIRRGVQALFE